MAEGPLPRATPPPTQDPTPTPMGDHTPIPKGKSPILTIVELVRTPSTGSTRGSQRSTEIVKGIEA
eukprot:c45674_g1_i1 orf=65-262(+)